MRDMLDPIFIHCPYCGESIEILVDSSVRTQQYVEDCQVCCRPIDIAVDVDEEGALHVSASSENDG